MALYLQRGLSLHKGADFDRFLWTRRKKILGFDNPKEYKNLIRMNRPFTVPMWNILPYWIQLKYPRPTDIRSVKN
jgi:hypothetical protein